MDENRVDSGLLEALRFYEEKRRDLIGSVDLNRRTAQFLVTSASVIFTVFAGLIGGTIPNSGYRQILFICFSGALLGIYAAMVVFLIRPLLIFKWIPGITGNPDKLLDFFTGRSEDEVIRRRISILIKEIERNRSEVQKSAERVDATQILFAFSIVILLAMFFISGL